MPGRRRNRDDSDMGSEKEEVGSFETLRDEGMHFVHIQLYQKAVESFTRALEMNPEDNVVLVTRAKCNLQLGLADNALADAEMALGNEKEYIRGLLMKAEALYQLGHFETALVYFHRGHKLRQELGEFRLGIQKAQEAINNSIGSPSSVKLDTTGDLSFFDKQESPVVETELPSEDEKDKNKKAPPKTYGKPVAAQKTMKERERPKSAVDTKTIKQLLEEMYCDREYLEKLLGDETLRGIKEPICDGLDYLDRCADFWQQQKPMYARKRDKEKMRVKGKSRPRDPVSFIMQSLEDIDEAQSEGRYEASLNTAKKLMKTVKDMSEEDLSNKWEIIANIHSQMGNAYLEMGKFSLSLENHESDLHIADDNDLDDAKSRALDNIGRVHARRGHYSKAIEIWERKLPLSKSPLEKTWLFHEIGRCYLESEKYGKARDYGEKSLDSAVEADDKGWQLHASVLVAQAEVKAQEFQSALSSFEKALELAKDLEDDAAENAITKALDEVNDKIAKGYRAGEDDDDEEHKKRAGEDSDEGRKSSGGKKGKTDDDERHSRPTSKGGKKERYGEDDDDDGDAKGGYEDDFEEDKEANQGMESKKTSCGSTTIELQSNGTEHATGKETEGAEPIQENRNGDNQEEERKQSDNQQNGMHGTDTDKSNEDISALGTASASVDQAVPGVSENNAVKSEDFKNIQKDDSKKEIENTRVERSEERKEISERKDRNVEKSNTIDLTDGKYDLIDGDVCDADGDNYDVEQKEQSTNFDSIKKTEQLEDGKEEGRDNTVIKQATHTIVDPPPKSHNGHGRQNSDDFQFKYINDSTGSRPSSKGSRSTPHKLETNNDTANDDRVDGVPVATDGSKAITKTRKASNKRSVDESVQKKVNKKKSLVEKRVPGNKKKSQEGKLTNEVTTGKVDKSQAEKGNDTKIEEGRPRSATKSAKAQRSSSSKSPEPQTQRPVKAKGKIPQKQRSEESFTNRSNVSEESRRKSDVSPYAAPVKTKPLKTKDLKTKKLSSSSLSGKKISTEFTGSAKSSVAKKESKESSNSRNKKRSDQSNRSETSDVEKERTSSTNQTEDRKRSTVSKRSGGSANDRTTSRSQDRKISDGSSQPEGSAIERTSVKHQQETTLPSNTTKKSSLSSKGGVKQVIIDKAPSSPTRRSDESARRSVSPQKRTPLHSPTKRSQTGSPAKRSAPGSPSKISQSSRRQHSPTKQSREVSFKEGSVKGSAKESAGAGSAPGSAQQRASPPAVASAPGSAGGFKAASPGKDETEEIPDETQVEVEKEERKATPPVETSAKEDVVEDDETTKTTKQEEE